MTIFFQNMNNLISNGIHIYAWKHAARFKVFKHWIFNQSRLICHYHIFNTCFIHSQESFVTFLTSTTHILNQSLFKVSRRFKSNAQTRHKTTKSVWILRSTSSKLACKGRGRAEYLQRRSVIMSRRLLLQVSADCSLPEITSNKDGANKAVTGSRERDARRISRWNIL